MNIVETILNIPAEHIRNLFGQFDTHAKLIEKTLEVTLISRENELKILGEAAKVQKAKDVMEELVELSMKGNTITEQNVSYALSLSIGDKEVGAMTEIDRDLICHTIQGKPIKPKTVGQKNYVDLIRQKMIVFGIGPAGTGKTYLAMAMGIQAFKNDEVSRIILTRPAIEAGEKLGFLPGDMQSKVDPYLRPLYDALYQIMGSESFQRNMEKGLIEVAPLAYMRGRTLDNAFIILDEAQNTTPAQMKMFLTRIGFGSKVIVTGDLTQKDLPAGAASGLDVALRVLERVEDIGFAYLTGADVVRHPLVQKIVMAYEDYEGKKERRLRLKEKQEKMHERQRDRQEKPTGRVRRQKEKMPKVRGMQKAGQSVKLHGRQTEPQGRPNGRQEEWQDKFQEKAREKQMMEPQNSARGQQEELQNRPYGQQEEPQNSVSGQQEELQSRSYGQRVEPQNSVSGQQEELQSRPYGQQAELQGRPYGQQAESQGSVHGQKEESQGKIHSQQGKQLGKPHGQQTEPQGKTHGQTTKPTGMPHHPKNPLQELIYPTGKITIVRGKNKWMKQKKM